MWAGDEEGATTVEYGLVAGLMGVVFVLAGPELYDAFLALLNDILDGMVG